MTPAKINELFARFSKANPEPKTELDYVNAYTLLVAVVLSAQATDKGVNKATPALFKKVKTPQAMLKLGEAGLKEYIKTIGLFNSKAKNIIAMSQALVDAFGGKVPDTFDALVSLPGVGRKSANVLLNAYFKQPTIAVDRHVLRVANRLGLAKSSSPDEVEKQLAQIVPAQWALHAHHWLVLHGRYVCTARAPHCPACLVRDLCPFKGKTKSPRL
ncbi:MAG: endonuclease III [Alphaproteobacteria bacterium]|nr:endonuclease III [Alphaproteobacteria bacterium]